jgi:tetratricopeptide (TPR) repeat protein
MINLSPQFLISIAKALASMIQTKHDQHDASIFLKDSVDYINKGNFDMAVGYINAAIEKSASDKDELSSLYLIKSAALLGWIGESKKDIILTNQPDASIGTLPESLETPTGKVSRLGNEALKSIDASIKLNPRNSLAYYFKGYVFFSLSELEEALKSFDNALTLGLPTNIQFFAYNMKGKLCLVLNKYDDALKCYENLLQLNPSNKDALDACEIIKMGLPVIISF